MNATFVQGFRTGYYRAGGKSINVKKAAAKVALKQLGAVTRCLGMSTLLYWLFQYLFHEPVNYYQILAIYIALMMESGGYDDAQSWTIRVGMFVGRFLSVMTTAVLCMTIIAAAHYLFG